MAKVQLLGGAYVARSVIAGMQRSLNLYIQQTPVEQDEPASAIHLPTPGMVPINTPTRVVDPAYHSFSDLECVLLNLRPKSIARAQIFGTSELDATIKRGRDLSSFLFVDTSFIGVTFNPLFRPLSESVLPLSTIAVAVARSGGLGASLSSVSLLSTILTHVRQPLALSATMLSSTVISVNIGLLTERLTPQSQLTAGITKFRAGLALNAAILPSSLLRANIIPLVEAIGSVTLLSGIVGKTLAPKALTAALIPGTLLHANIGTLRMVAAGVTVLTAGVVKFRAPKPLTASMAPVSRLHGNIGTLVEVILPGSLLAAVVSRIRPPKPITEALVPHSVLAATVHKRGVAAAAFASTSSIATVLHRKRKLSGALAPGSNVVATALSSRLQGRYFPTSALALTLKRGHALSASLNPRAVPTATLKRKRILSGSLVPRSVLVGEVKSPGRLVEVLAPKSTLGATLSPKSTGKYYTPVRNWYVAPNGNDPPTGQGTSVSPWRTPAGADSSGKLLPGDVINFASGTYNLTGTQYLNNGGNTNSLTGFVVYKSTTLYGAKLVMTVNTPDDVLKAQTDYVIFDGFEIDGGNAGVATLSAAKSIGSGIGCWGHHIIVTNCKIHDCGASGIQANFKDWYTFDTNITYNNSNWNGNQTSGISIYEPTNVPYTASAADLAATYRIQVINNTSYGNFIVGGTGILPTNHTDGNGIIMDDFLLNQTSNPYTTPPNSAIPYTHNSLVQGNTTYNNGGRGVHVFSSTKVICNANTAYNNMRDQGITGTERGDICAVDSINCTMTNNKGEPTSLSSGFNQYCTAVLHARNTSITWTGNATYDPRTGLRSYNIDDGTVAAAFPGANPLGGPLP